MLAAGLLVGISAAIVVNYLADALPSTRSLSQPQWWPISAESLRRYFSSRRVLIVLILSLIAGGLLFSYPPLDVSVYWLAGLLAYFGLVSVIDIEYRVVMHPVSLLGAVGLGAIGVYRHGAADTLLGGLAGFGFMLAIYLLGEGFGRLVARLRQEPWEETALGFGDVNLAGVIGLLMGWPGVVAALFVGMLLAALYSGAFLLATMVRRRYHPFASIPYAPFLSLGAVIMVLISVYRT